MSILVEKIKEVLYAVLPITIAVLILHFTIAPFEVIMITRFFIGALLIIIGLSIFLLGVDIGITPIGNELGSTLAKTNKFWIIAVAGLILGFIISIAEPDLHILAGQVDYVTSGQITKVSIVAIVSLGIAAFFTLGLLRIVYNTPLYKVLSVLYALVFVLAIFTSPEFLAISFDASGATTGALTVPFVLAFAMGISVLKKDSRASEKDSFGLVAVTSVGAIVSVMFMSIISKSDELYGSLGTNGYQSTSVLGPFLNKLPALATESFFALLPLLIIFLFFQKVSFKFSKRVFRRILKGILYSLIGLILFLVGVNAGFMELGSALGYNLASFDNQYIVVIVGLILGLVTILAEPAVHVLTHQIEEVTSGYVKRNIILVALSVGVGLAVALSMLRIIIPGIQLWHYLLPGYILAILLTYIVPKLFVGIAFDSGGVASGPMTATFILAFAHGAAEATEGANVLVDGFGVIAMVALTPLITLQILGLIFKLKSVKGGL